MYALMITPPDKKTLRQALLHYCKPIVILMGRHLFIFLLLLSSAVSAQKTDESHIGIRVVNSRFQFTDIQTNLPVNNQLWDEVDPFINGYARVFLKDKFSFVNNTAKLIAPVEFEDARNFINNLAAVKKNGKWGVINESGKIVIPFMYDIIFDFEERVSVAAEHKKWWLISNKGEVIQQLDISVCYGFKNGTAKIEKGDYEGLLYPDGNIALNQSKKKTVTAVSYHPDNNNAITPCPPNIDFENGNFTNWQCYTGTVDSVGNTNVVTVTPSPPTAGRHTIVPRVLPSAIDPFGLFPTNPPDGSNFAVKLGNTNVGAQAERIRYTIHVPLDDSNFTIKYDYAVVFQDPGHTPWTQPRFTAKLLDSATNTYIDCASFVYISTAGLPGFKVSTVNSQVIYKAWSSVFFSMRGQGGRTLYLEFTTADCVRRAHWGYAYVDVEATCGQAIDMQYNCIYPNITTLTGPPGFQTYNWWNQNFTTLVGTGQTITLNPGPVGNDSFYKFWLQGYFKSKDYRNSKSSL
jgi:WG containing repeat